MCPNVAPSSAPECVTLKIELGDGGNLNFTYKASPPPKISYQLHGKLERPPDWTAEIKGQGSFQLDGSLVDGCARGTNDHGSALLRIDRPNRGQYTVHLQSFAASYCQVEDMDGNVVRREVDIKYRVAKSTARCFPVGSRFVLHAVDRGPEESGEISQPICHLKSPPPFRSSQFVYITST
jgi:hypothetical protein